jgi:hypothetical protein
MRRDDGLHWLGGSSTTTTTTTVRAMSYYRVLLNGGSSLAARSSQPTSMLERSPSTLPGVWVCSFVVGEVLEHVVWDNAADVSLKRKGGSHGPI